MCCGSVTMRLHNTRSRLDTGSLILNLANLLRMVKKALSDAVKSIKQRHANEYRCLRRWLSTAKANRVTERRNRSGMLHTSFLWTQARCPDTSGERACQCSNLIRRNRNSRLWKRMSWSLSSWRIRSRLSSHVTSCHTCIKEV